MQSWPQHAAITQKCVKVSDGTSQEVANRFELQQRIKYANFMKVGFAYWVCEGIFMFGSIHHGK